jgi:y4mF family transcriptional regulator
MNNLSAFIRFQRKKVGLTQHELAAKAGVGVRFIRELEQGKASLQLDKVEQVLGLFGFQLSPIRQRIDAYDIYWNFLNRGVKITLANKLVKYGVIIEEIIDKDIRKYFVKDFYNDHLKRYKKRPIYWMFSSSKGHFKALIYMPRYQPDLCSKMLNDYLQPFISKLEAAKQTNTLLALREDVTAREKTLALKEVDRLELMIRDCKDYERTLFTIATQKITIDLDDGVKVNYLKFKEVLVPIKGLEKEED